MYVCPCECPWVCVFEKDVQEKRKKIKERKEIRKNDDKKRREEKTKQKLIHTDKQTYRQTSRRTSRHKSFIDMRCNTVQYDKSNSINLK